MPHARQQWRARIETISTAHNEARLTAHARQQWRARIETCCLGAQRVVHLHTLASNGGRGLKLDYDTL